MERARDEKGTDGGRRRRKGRRVKGEGEWNLRAIWGGEWAKKWKGLEIERE